MALGFSGNSSRFMEFQLFILVYKFNTLEDMCMIRSTLNIISTFPLNSFSPLGFFFELPLFFCSNLFSLCSTVFTEGKCPSKLQTISFIKYDAGTQVEPSMLKKIRLSQNIPLSVYGPPDPLSGKSSLSTSRSYKNTNLSKGGPHQTKQNCEQFTDDI